MRKVGARYHNANLSRLLSWQGRNVLCPALERLAHLGGVPSAVIYPGNASPVTADMV
ncbi:hypothetical protein [Bradyrhizobium sp. th.b2]|uniref:hypothetical protein n=1 Tax=Bradyrhizobium sp. th-b2 TaxID=172088 RepID=UPI001FD98CEF|nr:hypothetical protein [Bradyrhizobium sp. th.b2]